MCELLGLSANVPTDICFSFSTLMQRGGRTGPHKDGWGISLYEGKGARSFHDPRPSVASEVAELIRRHAIKSKIIVSHIRKANRGRVCLENTHPFSRELWGRSWVFAHNGQLRGIKRYPLGHYRTIGSTDSEHAFCWLLSQVRERFPRRPQDPRALWRLIATLADELATLGTFNMLLSDATHLYAYCNTHLHWLTRRAPFGKARSIDTGELVDFHELTTPRDVVTLVASRPLTDNETWQAMPPRRLTVWRAGLAVASVAGTYFAAVSGYADFDFDGAWDGCAECVNDSTTFTNFQYNLKISATNAPVPVPAAGWLLGSALLGLARRRKSA